MCPQPSDRAPTVLIVSKHDEFATTASRQLEGGFAVCALSTDEIPQALRSDACSPAVALVDCEADTPEGSAVRHAVHTALPDCQIVLICTLDQAVTGAQLARSGEVCDYLLTDSVRDPNRLSLVVQRASQKPLTDQEDEAVQYQRVLEALEDMRDLLTGTGKNPIARLLDRLTFHPGSNRLSGDLSQEGVGGYEGCLVEFISGRLRRLENQILLLGGRKAPARPGLTSGRTLVVEDDPVSGELAKHILERHGFDVVVAKTAVAAREALGKCVPDVVLMDIHLGDANGLELIKRLRAGSTCPDVPVIVTTSDRMRHTLLDAVDVNVQGYLLKPYQPSLLVEKVKAVVAGAKAQPADGVGPDQGCPT